MSMYAISVYLHIVGALGLFAALSLEWASILSLRRATTAAQVREWARLLASLRFVGPPAVLTILVTGIYDGRPLGQPGMDRGGDRRVSTHCHARWRAHRSPVRRHRADGCRRGYPDLPGPPQSTARPPARAFGVPQNVLGSGCRLRHDDQAGRCRGAVRHGRCCADRTRGGLPQVDPEPTRRLGGMKSQSGTIGDCHAHLAARAGSAYLRVPLPPSSAPCFRMLFSSSTPDVVDIGLPRATI